MISNELQVILFIFSCMRLYFELVSKIFLNGHKVLYVFKISCYCCLILLFVLAFFRKNDCFRQSNAAFFTPMSCLRRRRSLFIHIFLEKYLNFRGFLSVPHLIDFYAKNLDERGRNFMCERTLSGLLVFLYSQTEVIEPFDEVIESFIIVLANSRPTVINWSWEIRELQNREKKYVRRLRNICLCHNKWKRNFLSIKTLNTWIRALFSPLK